MPSSAAQLVTHFLLRHGGILAVAAVSAAVFVLAPAATFAQIAPPEPVWLNNSVQFLESITGPSTPKGTEEGLFGISVFSLLQAVSSAPSYDFASDYVSIDGNISPVAACTQGRGGQAVSFFDDFDDGLLNQGCTAQFGKAGTFTESGSFIRMASDLAFRGRDFLMHFLTFPQLFLPGRGSFEVAVQFRPDIPAPPPSFTVYGFFLQVEGGTALPNLSIQAQTAPDGQVFLVAGRNADPGRVFREAPVTLASSSGLVFKARYDDAARTITPLYSTDNGATFSSWTNADGSAFSVPLFAPGEPQNVRLWIFASARLPVPAPTVSDLKQLKSDGTTPITEGAVTTENEVVFQGTVTHPESSSAKLQVELREAGQPFTGAFDGGILESDFVPSGTSATVRRSALADGRFQWRARAVDTAANASAWQESGQEGNADFEVRTVPLYTQVESNFPSQADTSRWASRPYGIGDYADCNQKDRDTNNPIPGTATIGRCGCAITSLVMLLRYYGITSDAEGKDVNPLNLNAWLTSPPPGMNGYDKNGNLTYAWADIPYYAADPLGRAQVVFTGKPNVGNPFSFAELKSQLDAYLGTSPLPSPVILAEPATATTPSGHYIVATGKLDGSQTYSVRDPAWYETKYLSQPVANTRQRNYANSFVGLRLYQKLAQTGDFPPFLSSSLASPGELLLTDPSGRRTGKDPLTGQLYNEIPGASYAEDGISDPTGDVLHAPEHVSKGIWIPAPQSGSYVLRVTGTGTGDYTLTHAGTDAQGRPQTKVTVGNTAPGVVANYTVAYTPQQQQTLSVAPQDTTPPTTRLTTIRGTQGKRGWTVSEQEIALTAEDNPSGVGVFKTEYSLDNGKSWKRYEGPFTMEEDGAHLVSYRSEDFVGNKEQTRFSFIRVDQTPPEVRLSFDPKEKTLHIEGTDNLGEPSLTQNGTTYVFEDAAGHTTTIVLEETKQAGKELKATLKSIQYDTEPPITLNADLHAQWSTEKDGTLKELEQKLQARHFKVEAKYRGKDDATDLKAFIGEKLDREKTRATLPLLQIVKLLTERGTLRYETLAPFSAEFNGVSSILSRPSTPSLTLNSDFTLEAWVKILKTPPRGQNVALLAKWQPPQARSFIWTYQTLPDGNKRLLLCTSPTGSAAFTCRGLSTTFAPAADLGENEWHHIAVRFFADPAHINQVEVLIDGVNQTLLDSGLPLPAVNQSQFSLGAIRSADGALSLPCNCRLDEVRVWNAALTDDQIASSRFTELTGNEPNLAGHWSFAKNFLDSSPNQNDLTGENAVFSLDSPPISRPLPEVIAAQPPEKSWLRALLASTYGALSGMARAVTSLWR